MVSQSVIYHQGQWSITKYTAVSPSFVSLSRAEPRTSFAGEENGGPYSAKSVTIFNLKVMRVDDDLGLVLVKGAVSGPAKRCVC